MRRVLLHWRGVTVHSYTAMLYAAAVLGLIAGNVAANLAGLDSLAVLVAQTLLLIVALVGARALHVWIDRRIYRRNPRLVWTCSAGGASQLGGALLILPASAIVLKLTGLSVGPFWDVSAFALLVGVCVGKLGCLLNGCCAGRPVASRLAPVLPDQRGRTCRRIPSQLLESMMAALILVGAMAMWSWGMPPGTVFLGALLAHALARLALQPARESQDRLGGVNVQQALAGLLAVVALTGLLAAAGDGRW